MTTRLLIGTEKGLFTFESRDRGDWKLVSPDPEHKGWQAYSLYAQPGGDVFVGLSNNFYAPHLQRSSDGGRTWRAIEHSPRFPEGSERELKQVWSVKAAGDRLLCGVAHAALFESGDGGETWEWNQGLEGHHTRPNWQPGLGGLCLHTIVPDSKNPNRLFLGISAVGVFRSDDGGQSWNLKNNGIRNLFRQEGQPEFIGAEDTCCVHKFVQDPTQPDTLYQQNHAGVFRSTDAGDSWHPIENGLPSKFGFPIVMLPGKPKTLFTVPQEESFSRTFPEGRLGVYRSRDGGDSWERTHQGLDELNWGGVLRNSMIVDAGDPPAIYVGTSIGDVYTSLDEGESWRRLPGRFPRIESLAVVIE